MTVEATVLHQRQNLVGQYAHEEMKVTFSKKDYQVCMHCHVIFCDLWFIGGLVRLEMRGQ